MNEFEILTVVVVVLCGVVFFTARSWARGRKTDKSSKTPDAPRKIPKEWL
jgi:hypothetical protein